MEKNKNILCVVTFFRHGARNPCLRLDGDLKFVRLDGLITENGIANTLKKGQEYRLKYPNLLENPKNISALCSSVLRCQYSLFSRLKGILNDDIVFNKDTDTKELLEYFSKKVSSIKILHQIEEDNYFQILKKSYSREYLKKLKEEGDFKLLSDNLNTFLKENPLSNEVYTKYNAKVEIKYANNPLSSLYMLADYFLNGGRSDEVRNTIEYQTNVKNNYEVSKFIIEEEIEFEFLAMPIRKVPKYAKLLYNGFYKKLTEIFKSILAGESEEKVFLFSGHDNNIISYLTAIGHNVRNFDRKFDAELSYELVEKDGKFKIDVILNNEPITNSLTKNTYSDWKELEDILLSITKE